MPLLSFFDVCCLPGDLHFPTLRLPLYWLKQRQMALPKEGSVELCCTVTVALFSAHQMKQHTCARIENAYVVCAKEVCACVIIKLYELTNTLQLIPSLYLSSHKCYYISNLGPSFSITPYYLHPCVRNNPISTLTLRQLMSYIYMERIFLMFLDHTQRRTTVGRTPLDE